MSETKVPFLTPFQRRMIAGALTGFAFVFLLALVVGGIWLSSQLIQKFSLLLGPLAIALVLSLLLHPLVDVMQTRLKMSRIASVVILYVLFTFTIILLIALVLPVLISQGSDLFQRLPALITSARDVISQKIPALSGLVEKWLTPEIINQIKANLANMAGQLSESSLFIARKAGEGFLSVFGFVASYSILPVYLFFFLLAPGIQINALQNHLTFLQPRIQKDILFLIDQFMAIILSFFRGQILIGLIMGVAYAAGFSAIQLESGILIGFFMGVLNIIPYLGTILGLMVALPVAFFQEGGWAFASGGFPLLALVLIVFAAVQALEGWFLTPRIMGNQTGLHPVTIIVAIFFWGSALGGILGMVLAIPLTAFLVVFWRLLKTTYLPILLETSPKESKGENA